MSVPDALAYLNNDFEQIVVLDKNGSLYGVVMQADILSSIDPETMMDHYRLIDLLKIKKRDRWVNKEMITREIFRIMESYHHDAVIVVEKRKPIGIITTKDILHLLKRGVDMEKPIVFYMTTPVITISQNFTLNKALQLVQSRDFKRIVMVDDNGFLVGSLNQKELISIAYTRWVRMISSYQENLRRMNRKLEQKSKKFEKIAAIDPLTGLYNRMKFFDLFLSEYMVMIQRDNALSLLMIDLDHFKLVNDKYCHNMGDKVLVEVSSLLLRVLRNVDVVCRWGGEEFIVLLPAACRKDALVIAEKIRNAIEKLEIDGQLHITASIGLAEVKEGDMLYDVVERADKALYKAKILGRNRVVEVTE
jgi:diguanylate cyclase (GGDEF)-like protein